MATLCAGQPPPGCARRPHDRFRQTGQHTETAASRHHDHRHRGCRGRRRTTQREHRHRRRPPAAPAHGGQAGPPDRHRRTAPTPAHERRPSPGPATPAAAACTGVPRTAQAPDLRQRWQRVSAGFSCVSFFGEVCGGPLLVLPGPVPPLCAGGPERRERPRQPTGATGRHGKHKRQPAARARRLPQTGRESAGIQRRRAGAGLGTASPRLPLALSTPLASSSQEPRSNAQA